MSGRIDRGDYAEGGGKGACWGYAFVGEVHPHNIVTGCGLNFAGCSLCAPIQSASSPPKLL